MPWCFPVPPAWNQATQVNYGVDGGGYSGNGNGTFTSVPGSLPNAFVSLQNDKDRPTGYLWSLVQGPEGPCICVQARDGQALPLTIKWETDNAETAVSEFSEINKDDAPVNEKKSGLDACWEKLFGCTFSAFFTLCLNKSAIIAGLGVPAPTTSEVTRYCGSAANLNFTVDPTDGFPETVTTPDGAVEIPVDWNGWTDAEKAQWLGTLLGLDVEGSSLYSDTGFSLGFRGGRRSTGGGPPIAQLWAFARPSLAVTTLEKDCSAALACFEDIFGCSFEEMATSMDIVEPVTEPVRETIQLQGNRRVEVVTDIKTTNFTYAQVENLTTRG